MTLVQSARKYEDLLGQENEAEPYNFAMLFKGQGFFARLRAKRRFKLLKAIDDKLRRVLQPGEKVYFLTQGSTVSLGEQFIVGWIAFYLNKRALAFTSNRIVLLQIGSRNRPGVLVSQMPYGAIASIRSLWMGLCRVKLVNREVYKFQYVPKADRKFLTKFLTGVVQGTNAPFQKAMGIEHLCPHCFAVVPGFPPTCPSCNGALKSPLKAGLLSFLFPGIGDWYLGHRAFALFEMLCASLLWLALVVVPLTRPALVPYGPQDKHYGLIAGLILLVAHAIDGLLTRHFARKGHHPAGTVDLKSQSTADLPPITMPKPDMTGKGKLTLRRDQTASTGTADPADPEPPPESSVQG